MAKGSKSGGGSRKGRPNKYHSTFRTQLKAYCKSIGVDPHRFMADMIANTETIVYGIDKEGNVVSGPAVKPELKLKAAAELAQYLEPKLKAMDVEISGNADQPLEVILRRGH